VSDGIWIRASYGGVFRSVLLHHDATKRSLLKAMRTFLSLLVFAIVINVVFATLTMIFFRNQIENANSFIDYLFYAVGSLTTGDIGNHTPKTKAVKLWTSAYVLTAWVYIFYATINHITDVKFRLFG
jgi:hypothetical protein